MTASEFRLLRGLLAGSGVLATVTGTLVAARGPAGIPGGSPMSASNDSVMRFYAVWWASQGPVFWRLSRDPALPPTQLHAVCATTFLGGLARLAAAKQSGRPHALFQWLTVAELLLPPIMVTTRRTGPALINGAPIRDRRAGGCSRPACLADDVSPRP